MEVEIGVEWLMAMVDGTMANSGFDSVKVEDDGVGGDHVDRMGWVSRAEKLKSVVAGEDDRCSAGTVNRCIKKDENGDGDDFGGKDGIGIKE
ncbi:hypothetical protein LR48_Vigan07g086600 [Vigna angularis]|uniref:Uncharacterized protein n=1 Tax=Phaseolus angularis TaxID=3914 RepID=A0A0L9UX61_PHAAN|nr:hypothetical protein LR48_Vigan07g086600 [Vigna angularis]